MIAPQSALLPGDRLHLQHGPIDLIIHADGPGRHAAYRAAQQRFDHVLQELVDDLPLLHQPPDSTNLPQNPIALAMASATLPFTTDTFITAMAAVAGAVADDILSHMAQHRLTRAYVNNGGDIAFYLTPGQTLTTAVHALDGTPLGTIRLEAQNPSRGMATSGLGGRSLTRGIAQSVTVLAPTAAMADAAASIIANAVDLPGHPAIHRKPACDVKPDSDLGQHLIVTHHDPLSSADTCRALDSGQAMAKRLQSRGLIHAAILFLQGQHRIVGPTEILQPMVMHA
jgi:uncharacterized protein